jgi:hypothetical protein
MTRRTVRAAWPLFLLLLLAALGAHAGGCRKASSAARPPEVTPAAAHPWITPLMTPPPPLPTPTLWRKDITRVPALPE